LATKLEEARPDTKDPQPGKTEKKSLDLAARLTKKAFFPGGFDSAIAELKAPTTPAPVIGATAAAKPAWSDDYEQHNVAFAGAVDAERGKQAAAKKLPSGVPESGPLDAAQTTQVVDAASTQVQIDSNAATLRELYPKLATATGAPYVQLAAYIEFVERTLATLRNTTYEDIHAEFAKSVVVTFEFTDADGEVEKGDSVYMVGTQPELGSNKESRAIPLHKRGASFQSAPIDIINKFGSYLVLQFLVRSGSTIKKRYEIATVHLPKAKTATVTGDATSVTAS
jgi:hypothetical protein